MNIQKVRSLVLLIMFLLLPISFVFFSPVILLMGAAEGIIVGSAILFLLAFIISLFFGRIWCSWVCPFGALQDKAATINDSRITNPWIERVRYGIFLLWVGMFVYLLLQTGGIRMIDFFFGTTGGLSIGDSRSLIVYTVVIIIITLIALILGKRGVCHLFCPVSVLLSIGRWITQSIGLPALRIVANSDVCNHCGRCTRSCVMSLDVKKMVSTRNMEDSNCILCGVCVDKCPRNALSFRFSSPK